MMSAKFSFAFYVLLTALIVKNCQILDGIYFIFLKTSQTNLKGFQQQICTSVKISSYQLRQVLANFCKLVTLILAYNCVKGLRVTKIVKQIKFEGVWGESTILRGKDWCFTQFSTGIAAWLLLFLIWLLNQLSSIHSIISTDV